MKQNLQKAFTTSFAVTFLLLTVFGQTRAQSIINTFAGGSTNAFSGDNGPCYLAALNGPFGECTDSHGNVYICDGGNNRIRKVDAVTGTITTIAGNGNSGYSGDNGLAINAEFHNPQAVAVDTAGNVYIADTYNYVVRKIIKSTGIVTTIAGIAGNQSYSGDGGPAINATINVPIGIAADDSGNVFISDHYANRIREISSVTGDIRTMAGGGSNVGNGPGASANFSDPEHITTDDLGNVYVSDQYNNAVWKIMAKSDSVFCVAGNPPAGGGYTGDGGLATAAQLNTPCGVAVDGQGNIYIADASNNVIRKVTKSTGIITTFAGNGSGNYSGDGGPAISAGISSPYDVAVDKCGNVYSLENVANDSRVRIIYTPDSTKVNPNPAYVCNGNSATLTASGGNTYTWQPATGLGDSTGAVVSASPSITTTYTATANTGCGGGLTVVPATVVVTVGSGSTLTISPPSASFCSGKSVKLITSGNNITWSPVTGLNSSTGDTVNATPTVTTTYTATAGGGNCPATGQVVITIAGSDTGGTVTAVRDTICQGTPGNLTLTGNSSSTIQWESSTDSITFNALAHDTLSSLKTTALQQTTWYYARVGAGGCSAVSDTLRLYVPPALTALFYSTSTGDKQLTFNSDSSIGNIRSYHWDFGDGQTSTGQNPSHTFAKDSTYYVCLTLYDGSNCSYTFCRYSSITDAVQTISANSNWVIYPNPVSEQLTIESKQINSRLQSIELYDVLGRMVFSKAYETQSNFFTLDLAGLAQGMYYLQIKTADANFFEPVIKQR